MKKHVSFIFLFLSIAASISQAAKAPKLDAQKQKQVIERNSLEM